MKHSRRTSRSRAPFRTAALLAVICVLLTIILILCVLRAYVNRAVRTEMEPPSPGTPDDGPIQILSSPDAAPVATQAPAPAFSFVADVESPPPAEKEQVAFSVPRTFDGTISCNYPLTRVTAMIVRDYCEDPFYPVMASVSFDPAARVNSYRLSDANTIEGVSLSSLLDLGSLMVGVHKLVLTGVCENQFPPSGEAFSVQFYVLGNTWQTVGENLFSNNSYSTALAFFGGERSRFMYRYQNGYGRYTVADPDWESQYITEFPMDDGDPWLIHIDAVPYYEQVRSYLDSTRVRVHGTNGDTGVLPLRALVVAYHGSYVSRFTSATLRYYSHHGLGTASDLNADLAPNKNTKANLALIDTEVRDLLAYNGILTDADGPYYDFTYSGSYACTASGVPETVINYLLYELAFYRAGFQWGHYYNSTSDAMHFVLTDNIKTKHNSAKGLQKVKEYYN